MVFTYALDGNDMMEAVALDWEKVGIKVKRVPENFGNFLPKNRDAQDQQDPLGLRLAALRRARPGLAALHAHQGRLRVCSTRASTTKEIDAAVAEIDTDKRAKLTHEIGPEALRRTTTASCSA